jgi:thiol-disulfide isomerase/thioredoxin
MSESVLILLLGLTSAMDLPPAPTTPPTASATTPAPAAAPAPATAPAPKTAAPAGSSAPAKGTVAKGDTPPPAAPKAKRHTILFFTASWCPACLKMKSLTLPKVALPGHVLQIIDVDANPRLSDQYGVNGLPAYIILDGVGRAYKHGVGFRDVQQFVTFLNGAAN